MQDDVGQPVPDRVHTRLHAGVAAAIRTRKLVWFNRHSAQKRTARRVRNGGPGRVRTDDLFHAMEARSQLRHRPTFRKETLNNFRLLACDSQTPANADRVACSVTLHYK